MATINNVVEVGPNPEPPEDAPAIVVEHLVKRFGDTVAVGGVSFAVAPGEIFGYLGRNGSGKTTTVRMLATLTRPTAGSARICGVAIADARCVRGLIGVTMQEAALDDAMTAGEHLRFVGGLSGLGRSAARRRALEVLEVVGLAEEAGARIGTYSGGMKRRLDIASALISRPPVLFLDEPTTGLDPQSRRAVWDEIRRLQVSGVTVLLTTQYLEEADRLADRLAIVDAGVVVAEGSPRALKADHGHTTIRMVHEGDASRLEDALDGELFPGEQLTVDPSGRAVVALATGDEGGRVLQLLDRIRAAGISPARLAVAETSLEDVFIRLTGTAIGVGSSGGPGEEERS